MSGWGIATGFVTVGLAAIAASPAAAEIPALRLLLLWGGIALVAVGIARFVWLAIGVVGRGSAEKRQLDVHRLSARRAIIQADIARLQADVSVAATHREVAIAYGNHPQTAKLHAQIAEAQASLASAKVELAAVDYELAALQRAANRRSVFRRSRSGPKG